MQHPTQLEMKAYRRRELPPEQMLLMDDHVAACAPCRRLLRDCEPLAGPAVVLAQLGEPHPTYEAIESYVDQRATRNERARIDRHVEHCRQCREEVADLQEFRTSLLPAPTRLPTATRRRLPVWLAAAAAVVLAAGAAWWWDVAHRPPDLVEMALATGELNVPEPILALRGAPSVVRGSAAGASFALLAPVGTAVVDDRPQFTWAPPAAASAYRVAIFASGFRKVGESAWLASSEWTPPEPLQRGQVYSWEVTARMGITEDSPTVRAPSLSDPEARFEVMGAPDAAALERVRREHPESHLLLGVLCARAGALDLAEQELARHVTANPQSAQAARLLEKVRTMRGQ
ncbi:MAG TPA: zf-HC2 domain-containing protein [Bryobacteraceae bacterium]|jgi:hypothetical protein|nr:zf-HC2 domain-containing protein [Bryobacteraceae bacterium]